MRIYLDVSCYNRRFDDQTQLRVMMETEAIGYIFELILERSWELVSSEIAEVEINAIPNDRQRDQVAVLLPSQHGILSITDEIRERANWIMTLGIKAADALHVASAEAWKADVLLSCDDRLVKRAKKNRTYLKVRVANPFAWIEELISHDDS